MAGVKISQLPNGSSPLSGNEYFPAVQNGETVKLQLSALGISPLTAGGIFFEDPTVFFVQYIPPANARFLYIFMCGGGGGGGGGGWGDYTLDPLETGGGGGAGGLRKEFWFPLYPRPSEILINVGAGGAGGAAGTSVGGGGGDIGQDGVQSEIIVNYPDFNQITIIAGQGFGAGGGGVGSSVANGGIAVPAQPYLASYYPTATQNSGNVLPEYNMTSGGGGNNTANLFNHIWKGGSVVSAYHPSGGGGGGSIDYVNNVQSGDGGESFTPLATIYGGIGTDPANINGKNGNPSGTNVNTDYQWNDDYPSWLALSGTGGGGGGASTFSYSSGNGGNGYRGGGGGGGGAFNNENNFFGLAGNGGNGGNGYVIIYEFY